MVRLLQEAFALKVIVQVLVKVMVRSSAADGTPFGLQFVEVLKSVPAPPEPDPIQERETANAVEWNRNIEPAAIKNVVNSFFIGSVFFTGFNFGFFLLNLWIGCRFVIWIHSSIGIGIKIFQRHRLHLGLLFAGRAPVLSRLVIFNRLICPGRRRSLHVLLTETNGCQRSEEHTSELQSHSFISYAVF